MIGNVLALWGEAPFTFVLRISTDKTDDRLQKNIDIKVTLKRRLQLTFDTLIFPFSMLQSAKNKRENKDGLKKNVHPDQRFKAGKKWRKKKKIKPSICRSESHFCCSEKKRR